MSKWTRVFAIVLAVVLIVVTLLPVGMTITREGGGILSLETRVALAVQQDMGSEGVSGDTTRYSGITIVEEMPWGYLYILENGDVVEVGDSTITDFKAHVKTTRWNGVADFSLGWAGGTFIPTLNGTTVSFDFNNDISVSIYPVPPSDRLPEGGIEYDITISKKPAKSSVILDINWNGITWTKILPLDEEYTQVLCEEEWGIELAPFTITQTSIVSDATSEVLKTREVYEVNSYIGEATTNWHKVNEMGGGVTYGSVSRSHLYIHRGQMTDALGDTAWIEDINLDEAKKQITFSLPKTWLRDAEYPVSQICGVDPAYTEDMDSWMTDTFGDADNTWSDYDLYTNMGVPKGAVAEIILGMQEPGIENTMGVRTDGSSLGQRHVLLHEAEGDGETHCRMFVVCNATTGLIECFHSDVTDDDSYYLVGYWENVDFTESIGYVASPSSSSWQEICPVYTFSHLESETYTGLNDGSWTRGGNVKTLSAGSEIRSASFLLSKTGAPTGTAYCRVRAANDTILATLGSIDVSTMGSSTWYTFDDTTATIPSTQAIRVAMEYLGGDSTNFIAIWSELEDSEWDRTAYSSAWSNWATITMSMRIEIFDSNIANRIAHIALQNSEHESNTMGVRSTSSSLSRSINVHEAESGGTTALDMFVLVDSNSKIDVYTTDIDNTFFCYLGYFGSELDFVEKWDAITNDGDSDWDATDLTTYLDQDGRVCDFLLTHNVINAEQTLGVRGGDDASTLRYLLEHEAEDDGSTTGEVTGFGISAQSNASGVVNLYSDTTSEVFYLMGYFKPSAAAADISNAPTSKAFGTVAASTSYWSYGSAPTFPLDDAECYFTVTNNGGTCSIAVQATNFAGGVGWTLGTPAENVVRLKAGKSGDALETNMVTLTTSPQAFISALAGSTTKKWEIKMETPTSFTDGALKTSTVTLTATLD